jgi:hypothetical protein
MSEEVLYFALNHFLARAKDTKDWNEDEITPEQLIALIRMRIETVSFKNIKEDVVRFIKNDDRLQIWSPKYFKDLLGKIKIKTS